MAKDRFKIPLACPSCQKKGQADCWQEDGWAFVKGKQSTYVSSITPGFSRVNQPSNWGEDINFVCNECNELCAKN